MRVSFLKNFTDSWDDLLTLKCIKIISGHMQATNGWSLYFHWLVSDLVCTVVIRIDLHQYFVVRTNGAVLGGGTHHFSQDNIWPPSAHAPVASTPAAGRKRNESEMKTKNTLEDRNSWEKPWALKRKDVDSGWRWCCVTQKLCTPWLHGDRSSGTWKRIDRIRLLRQPCYRMCLYLIHPFIFGLCLWETVGMVRLVPLNAKTFQGKKFSGVQGLICFWFLSS